MAAPGASRYGRAVDEKVASKRLADARVGHLGTISIDGRPHVVPCCFAVHEDTVYSAVDAKPKSTLALRRLRNVRAHPSVTLLADHYDEDWSTLWWIRVDGTGRIVEGDRERSLALSLLAAKYSQYRATPPPGEVIALDIGRWVTWP
jgi:PPOX class probable F420-dependent enzyme